MDRVLVEPTAEVLRAQRRELIAAYRERARRSLIDFTIETKPDYDAGWFHCWVAAELDQFLADVVAGKSPRLMLFAPPRHGKTELVSRRFPAYALGRFPDLSFIATSYGADLASSINRDVQRIIDSPEFARLFPDTKLFGSNVRTVTYGSYLRNSDIFEIVGHRGVYKSAGVGGGVTGRGGQIVMIDDPVKDASEAYSQTVRQGVWDWYTTTLRTRVEPGGGMLLIMTRWHEDDLAGRLLEQMKKGDEFAEQWRVVSPAIAEVDEPFRKQGEPLHPERYDIGALTRLRSSVGSVAWTALFQQRPAPLEGSLVRLEWFKRYTPEQLPARFDMVVQSWDTAMKETQISDYSVCTTWGVAKNGVYLLHVHREQMEYPKLRKQAAALAEAWKPSHVLIEDKASGQSLIQDFRESSLWPVLPVNPDGDKVIRFMAASPMIEAGRVFIPEAAPWLDDYIHELLHFPNAAKDDQADSTSQALRFILTGGGSMGIFEFMRQQTEEVRQELAKDHDLSEAELDALEAGLTIEEILEARNS